MDFTRSIIISILSHLLFIGFLVIIYPAREVMVPVFDVDIVDLFEVPVKPPQRTRKQDITKKKPPVTYQNSRLHDSRLLPETRNGEDSASTPPATAPPLLPRYSLFDKETIERFARRSYPDKNDLTFDASEFRHRGYMRMLKEKIEGIWGYPKEAARRGISGDLYIRFSIKRDGGLGKVELLRTSGYRDLDEAAMKALKDAKPFWPLPEDYEKDNLEIEGHFIYILGRTYIM